MSIHRDGARRVRAIGRVGPLRLGEYLKDLVEAFMPSERLEDVFVDRDRLELSERAASLRNVTAPTDDPRGREIDRGHLSERCLGGFSLAEDDASPGPFI